MTIFQRKLAGIDTPAIGLGCMNLSHAYGTPPPREAGERVLQKALDIGITHFDSATLYGFGRNEELVGPFLKPHRQKIFLASKCGMRAVDGKRVIDGHPDRLVQDLEESLRRLQTDLIDLYYLHRLDKRVPIEDSVGALSRLVEQGKIRAIGLSEVSAQTLLKAHAVHPIAAVQSEYSLWSRNAELGVLDTCEQIGAAFVAFSPVARGFLTSTQLEPAQFAEKDIRRGMPRFQEPHFSKNQPLRTRFCELAELAGCTPAQLALAWVLGRRPFIHAIPGTTSAQHLAEDFQALEVEPSAALLDELDTLINNDTVSGPRYPAGAQADIDTEEFA
jgi:aryl-alcohol dehydrogenase-like predicted oxidoreductase